MGMGQFATGLIGELIVDGGGLDTRMVLEPGVGTGAQLELEW